MTFLPIVQRELRVAARKPAAFRTRFAAAALTAALAGFHLVVASARTLGAAPSGEGLFTMIVMIDLLLALSSGVLLSSDCLSRERREGTLGFLFLTDLNGFDVVAGKFVALTLLPLQALLATLPVAGLTVFLGGVTAAEFWRALLLLVNTLFVSMAMGICVSSLTSDDRKAMGMTLAGVGVFAGVPLLFSGLLSRMFIGSDWNGVALFGPAGVLTASADERYSALSGPFWKGLLGQHLLGWAFLLAGAAVARRVWRVRDDAISRYDVSTVGRGLRARRGRAVGRRFAANPFAWHSWRTSWVRRGIWWATVATTMAAAGSFAAIALRGNRFEAGNYAIVIITAGFFLLKILLAAHAVCYLQDLGRTGATELLLATPVTSRFLREGHLAAMRTLITWPFLTLAALFVAASTGGAILAGGSKPHLGYIIAPPSLIVLVNAMDLVAVGFYASRWALHHDRPAKVLARTTLLVIVLPAVLCSHGRFLIDLLIIGRASPLLDQFRELLRAR